MDLEFRGEVQARDKYLEFISRQMILEATRVCQGSEYTQEKTSRTEIWALQYLEVRT